MYFTGSLGDRYNGHYSKVISTCEYSVLKYKIVGMQIHGLCNMYTRNHDEMMLN